MSKLRKIGAGVAVAATLAMSSPDQAMASQQDVMQGRVQSYGVTLTTEQRATFEMVKEYLGPHAAAVLMDPAVHSEWVALQQRNNAGIATDFFSEQFTINPSFIQFVLRHAEKAEVGVTNRRPDRYDIRASAMDPVFASLAETMPRIGNGNLTSHGLFVNQVIKDPRVHQMLDSMIPGSVGEFAREFAMQFPQASVGALHYQFSSRVVEMLKEQGIDVPTAPGAGGQGNLVHLPTFTGNAEFTGNEWLLQLAIWMQEQGHLEGEIWQSDENLVQLPTEPGQENTGGGNVVDLPTGGPSQGIDMD